MVAVVQLATALGLVLGMHTMLGVFATALPTDAEVEVVFEDPIRIPLQLNPVNNGYLEASLEVRLALEVDGEELAFDEAQVSLPPGGSQEVELVLLVPLEEGAALMEEGAQVDWVTDIKVTTLFNLISFSNHIEMEGVQQ